MARNRKQPQMDVQPMQEHYPVITGMTWTEPDEDGNRGLITHCPLPNKVMVFHVPAEVVRQLCMQGLAPTVAVATPAQAQAEAAAVAGAEGGLVLPGGARKG